jgi:hypothetical protein
MHKWVVMSNAESEIFGEVTSLLKLSISVMGPDDKEIEITDDNNPLKEEFIQPP